MIGDAPFVGLSDLGIDMQLGEYLGMPPTDPGIERAMEVTAAECVTSINESEETKVGTESEGGVTPTAEGLTGPTIA